MGEEPREGVVVLNNGNVLQGEIRLDEQHISVLLAGGEFRIRRDQVEMCCADLDEAYQRRRDGVSDNNPDAHLKLARWCLRQGLLQQAAAELETTRNIEPDHRHIPLLERQLVQLIKLARDQEQRLSRSLKPEDKENESIDLDILQQAPKWSRAIFVRQIQPLLIHSCSTTGCHQPGNSEQYSLNRLAMDGTGHPDLTLGNLAGTLHQIDWENPTESRLLKLARSFAWIFKQQPTPILDSTPVPDSGNVG